MHRGSTPTLTFELNITPESLTAINVAFAQNGEVKLEKGIDDCTITGNKIAITLTEDETLLFETDGLNNSYVDVQFRFGFGEKRVVSDIVQVIVKPILKEGKL